MSITMGIDVGVTSTKAAVMEDKELLAYAIVPTGVRPDLAARECYEKVLSEANIGREKLHHSVSTGWGAKRASFVDTTKPDIMCIGKGAVWACPSARTVIDIGGQTVKVLNIDKTGDIINFELSDRCASGTGRFLVLMASVLELKIDELGKIASTASKIVPISSQCSVFAESEIITHVNAGEKVADIINGINYSIARRISTTVRRAGFRDDVIVIGGVAKNTEVVRHLGDMLGIKFKDYGVDPQVISAIGAALLAQEE